MQRARYILCCWPGLAQLWLGGRWYGLVAAGAFSLLLNFALLTTFVWPAWTAASVSLSVWLLLLIVWVLGAVINLRSLSGYTAGAAHSDSEDLYTAAQNEYLRGNWYQAEALLERLLRKNRRDVDGQLLLASLYRFTRRPDEARRQLDVLEQFEDAARWRLEIAALRRQLDRIEQDIAGTDETLPDEPTDRPADPRSADPDESRQAGSPKTPRGPQSDVTEAA